MEQLIEYSKATALTEVVRIVDGLEDIKANLTFMKAATNDLRTNASQLNDGKIIKTCTFTVPNNHNLQV